ncbi:hypothetical protein P5E67_00810 [Vibrio parahaemolyticus]|nr:hypothetical protein [Vibrio parahaemolyticus]
MYKDRVSGICNERVLEKEIERHKQAFELMTKESNNMYTKMSRLHKYLKVYARCGYPRHSRPHLKQSAILFNHAQRTDETFKQALTKIMSVDETLTMQDVELVLARTIVIHRQVVDYMKKLATSECI